MNNPIETMMVIFEGVATAVICTTATVVLTPYYVLHLVGFGASAVLDRWQR